MTPQFPSKNLKTIKVIALIAIGIVVGIAYGIVATCRSIGETIGRHL